MGAAESGTFTRVRCLVHGLPLDELCAAAAVRDHANAFLAELEGAGTIVVGPLSIFAIAASPSSGIYAVATCKPGPPPCPSVASRAADLVERMRESRVDVRSEEGKRLLDKALTREE